MTLAVYFGTQETSIPDNQLSVFDYESYSGQLPAPFNTLQACILLEQTHGTAGHSFTHYHEALDYTQPHYQGDYLITPLKQVGLVVATADCLPIILHDARQDIVAALHAGWRGAVAGIAQTAVEHMVREFGTRRGDVQVQFGPSAGGCCYEVSSDWCGPSIRRAGKYYFDNKLFNAQALEKVGVSVTPETYATSPCTICDTRFCSYRRQGRAAARQLTIAVLM